MDPRDPLVTLALVCDGTHAYVGIDPNHSSTCPRKRHGQDASSTAEVYDYRWIQFVRTAPVVIVVRTIGLSMS